MASVGFDQFWADSKPSDNNTVTPVKKKTISRVSSMSTPQSTSVTRTSANMQAAAKRKLKKYQEDQNS